MNCTIWNALNQCSTTGYEVELRSLNLDNGFIVKLFRDHKGWHRVALFESDAPDSGLSGVIIQPDGEVYYKQTATYAQGNNYTRKLQAMLTVWGIEWHRSELLTESGAACYKGL
jgi:hypothetical protein